MLELSVSRDTLRWVAQRVARDAINEYKLQFFVSVGSLRTSERERAGCKMVGVSC
jgi:hypothetical protein